jgi:hypothetical protein
VALSGEEDGVVQFTSETFAPGDAMSTSSNRPIPAFALLVEGPSGVAEYLLGHTLHNGKPALQALEARVVSGHAPNVSTEDLNAAVELQRWAQTHPGVFLEARATADPQK